MEDAGVGSLTGLENQSISRDNSSMLSSSSTIFKYPKLPAQVGSSDGQRPFDSGQDTLMMVIG